MLYLKMEKVDSNAELRDTAIKYAAGNKAMERKLLEGWTAVVDDEGEFETLEVDALVGEEKEVTVVTIMGDTHGDRFYTEKLAVVVDGGGNVWLDNDVFEEHCT